MKCPFRKTQIFALTSMKTGNGSSGYKEHVIKNVCYSHLGQNKFKSRL